MTVLLALMATSAVLIFVARSVGSSWLIVSAALICAALSVYSFLQGAWPVGLIEAVWVLVVLHNRRPSSRNLRML